MFRINQLKMPVAHTRDELVKKVKKLLRLKEEPEITIIRRSVDARKKPELSFNYIIDVKVKNEKDVYGRCDKRQVILHEEKQYQFPIGRGDGRIRPVITGMGPAGLFCGYLLAEAGFAPILLERGREIEQRTQDVKAFWETGVLNTESNVQFGEGGAGTFSDGKLNTLVKDKDGRSRKVLSVFVKEGAPEEILYDSKPHMGTDMLAGVIRNMRKEIIRLGGEMRFSAQVTGIETENSRIKAVIVNNKERLPADYLVLAVGHSARDTVKMLYEAGLKMSAKAFAVGLRVEHPQCLINESQYGVAEHKLLGNASYKLTAKAADNRGVYSFCMCPGGYVVNASSEEGRLAVNGMSYSKRDGKNANSAIIVTVEPKDYGGEHPLSGIGFQRRLEEKAYLVGNGKIPVELYGDFKRAVLSDVKEEMKKEEGKEIFKDFTPCCRGDFQYAPVHEILPPELSKAFAEGMEQFGRMIPGFNNEKALVEGVESRTSSPVRMERDETLQASIKGIYPCGEGAGYAGGIMSAAMDGIRAAEEIAKSINALK